MKSFCSYTTCMLDATPCPPPHLSSHIVCKSFHHVSNYFLIVYLFIAFLFEISHKWKERESHTPCFTSQLATMASAELKWVQLPKDELSSSVSPGQKHEAIWELEQLRHEPWHYPYFFFKTYVFMRERERSSICLLSFQMTAAARAGSGGS